MQLLVEGLPCLTWSVFLSLTHSATRQPLGQCILDDAGVQLQDATPMLPTSAQQELKALARLVQ